MKCDKDHIINPATGRCVLKRGTIGKKILAERCNNKEVLNPLTYRCVNKNGNIGRKIIKRTPSPKKKSPKKKSPKKKSPKKKSPKKKCLSGKYINSKTGRCRQIPNEFELNSKGKNIVMGAPDRISKILNKCSIGKAWPQKKKMGRGSVGSTYRTCKGDDCEYVLKIQKDDYEFRNEVKILRGLKSFKHAPKMFAAWVCKGKGYIVEEKLNELSGSREKKYMRLKKAIKLLNSKGYAFPDCHAGNVMERSDGTLVFIDFGWATYFPTKTSTIWEPIWLSDTVEREVTLSDVIAWQNVNMEEEFGTKTGYNKATIKFDEIF
jgi:hypothetical protein